MNESEYMQLREAAWRRQLNPEEERRLQSYLLIHPEAQVDWEEEKAITSLLLKLPDEPLASNFTAQLLQRLDMETGPQRRTADGLDWWKWRRFLPRFALAALVISAGGIGYQQYQHHAALRDRANSVAIVTTLAENLPDVKMWQDFDAIARLNEPTPSRDDVLWAALSSANQSENP